MPTFSSRLGLIKQAGGEDVDVDLLNANFDRLDSFAGVVICTSTTRPTGTDRFVGCKIFETDTNFELVWNGTRWVGRPYHIERFRNGLTGSVAAATWEAIALNGTRNVDEPMTATATDWGLSSFTQQTTEIKLPVKGLWQFQAEISTISPSTKLLRVRIEPDPVGQPGVYKYMQSGSSGSNSNAGAISVASYHLAGAKVIVEVNVASGTGNQLAIANDSFTNSGARTYLSAMLLKEA